MMQRPSTLSASVVGSPTPGSNALLRPSRGFGPRASCASTVSQGQLINHAKYEGASKFAEHFDGRPLRQSMAHLAAPLFGGDKGGEGGGGAARESVYSKNQWPDAHSRVMQKDGQGIKAEIDKQRYKEPYDVKKFYKEEGRCQAIARASWFENLTFAVITFNALWLSVDADLNNAETLVDAHPVFIVAENLFCIFFCFELAMRFGAFRLKRNCLRDYWFLFDSFMVALMIFETWIMTIVILVSSSGGTGGLLGNVTMLKMLRLLRLSRMARMARLLRSVPELLILIKGMVAALRTVSFALCLLLVLLYCFAVAFRMLAEDTPAGETVFRTIPRSANKLVSIGIFGDGLGNLSKLFISEKSSLFYGVVMWLLFYLFVLLAVLAVMNMLIGVLCEMVSNVGHQEREDIAIQTLREGLLPLVQDDPTQPQDDIIVSKEKFEMLLDNRKFGTLLNSLDVDLMLMVDLLDSLFSDEQGMEIELVFGDLLGTILDLRSTTKCTVRNVTDVRRFLDHQIAEGDRQKQEQLLQLQAVVNSFCAVAEKFAKVEPGTVAKNIDRRRHVLSYAMLMPVKLEPNSRWRDMMSRLAAAGFIRKRTMSMASSLVPSDAPNSGPFKGAGHSTSALSSEAPSRVASAISATSAATALAPSSASAKNPTTSNSSAAVQNSSSGAGEAKMPASPTSPPAAAATLPAPAAMGVTASDVDLNIGGAPPIPEEGAEGRQLQQSSSSGPEGLNVSEGSNQPLMPPAGMAGSRSQTAAGTTATTSSSGEGSTKPVGKAKVKRIVTKRTKSTVTQDFGD